MESHHNKTPILIIGAMGHLGTRITRHALQEPTLLVNIMVHDPKMDKELATMVEKSGGKVLQGSLSDPKCIKESTKGIHTVISAVKSDDEKIMVDGHISLMKICMENGVQRVVPPEFSINYERFHRDEVSRSSTLRPKMMLHDLISTTTSIPKILRIQTGVMMETLLEMIRSQGVGYYGDSTLKHDMTSCDDIARLVVSAVSKTDLTGAIALVGCTNTMGEIVSAYNKVRGTKLECKRLGSLEDLKMMCEERRKQGHMEGAEQCLLLSMIYDPRSKFEKTHNSMIPTVKTMSIEEFLKMHPEITIE